MKGFNIMKLLIVDDEELTRTGVISSIDWKELGISEVFQADDGINGLEMAKKYQPEIILCDVRMPRMDGITMLERLESILPDTIPIFMSGYSDKEYLMAAIKLKAVSYIEKPIKPQEICDAVLEARDRYTQKVYSRRGQTLRSMETASRLALALTVPYDSTIQAEVLAQELSLSLTPSTCFTSIIVRLDSALELTGEALESIYHALHDFLDCQNMSCIYVAKREQYLVYDIISPSTPSPAILQSIGEYLGKQYQVYGKYLMAAGDTFAGISKAYQSYTSAVILLQSSYFFPSGSFLTSAFLESQQPSSGNAALPAESDHRFSELLSAKDSEKTSAFLEQLYHFFYKNHTLLPNQVKDLYYKYFVILENTRKQQHLPDSVEQDTIVSSLEKNFTYQELHEELVRKTQQYFTDLKNSIPENSTIFLIKDYISKNYMNETLSVKDISAHVFLSASYVCTFFKNETGQTLNQYLTEFRMEKAKQLLSDPRYKIADISSRVGYSDGNYFGKSFKKYTGVSPSEFRERMI